MADIGKIGMVLKGTYDNDTAYEVLDIVTTDGASYVAKKNTTGNAPSENSEYWQLIARSGTLSSLDTELDTTSNNAVSNKAIAEKFEAIEGDIAGLDERVEGSLTANSIKRNGTFNEGQYALDAIEANSAVAGTMAQKIFQNTVDIMNNKAASASDYSNARSGLESTNVQEAIDETVGLIERKDSESMEYLNDILTLVPSNKITSWTKGEWLDGGIISPANDRKFSNEIAVKEGDVVGVYVDDTELAYRITFINGSTKVSEQVISENKSEFTIPSGVTKILFQVYFGADTFTYAFIKNEIVDMKAQIDELKDKGYVRTTPASVSGIPDTTWTKIADFTLPNDDNYYLVSFHCLWANNSQAFKAFVKILGSTSSPSENAYVSNSSYSPSNSSCSLELTGFYKGDGLTRNIYGLQKSTTASARGCGTMEIKIIKL